MPNIPHILLAAGGSTRMGQPKALLLWGNKTLLEARMEALLETEQPVVVVLNSDTFSSIQLPSSYPIHMAENNHWFDGMGSSLTLGVKEVVRKYPDALAVLISHVDQPLIPTSHYAAMFEQFERDPEKIIVSESVEGWKAPPVLFPASFFQELLKLDATESGKTLIQKYPNRVQTVAGNDYLVDMDTPEEYRALLRRTDY